MEKGIWSPLFKKYSTVPKEIKQNKESTNGDYYIFTKFNVSSELGQTTNSPKLDVVIFWLLLDLTQKYIILAVSLSQIKFYIFLNYRKFQPHQKVLKMFSSQKKFRCYKTWSSGKRWKSGTNSFSGQYYRQWLPPSFLL